MPRTYPKVSVVIPTLNAGKVLDSCLTSIRSQSYPQNQIEIIIADGGSADSTLKIAQKFDCKVMANPLQTAEAGKAVGAGEAKGEFIALIDSDNILPDSNWLNQMLEPLTTDPKIIGSEPWEFTYRPQSGFIERYSALIGANDPYAFVTGIFDRRNLVNFRWTGLNLPVTDHQSYLTITLSPDQPLPTIGANGTILRRKFVNRYLTSDYLFDIDLISQALSQSGQPLLFAKVKCGIIHTYCESSFSKFLKKQQRRITDFQAYRSTRSFDWSGVNRTGALKFGLYTITFIPALIDSIRGFIHRPDPAWFFHPLACLTTLGIYAGSTLTAHFSPLKPYNRSKWHQ